MVGDRRHSNDDGSFNLATTNGGDKCWAVVKICFRWI